MEIKNFVRSNPIAGCNECSKNCSSSVNGHHHALHLQIIQKAIFALFAPD